ncbi:TPA: tail fiber assembly protein, partial [Escherichia coli]|nr:tail fiber assembly protein [Escherichia coli]HEI0662994.1 tail fiber assembly protein [Escherichia coli]
KKNQIISGVKSNIEFLQTQLLLDIISDEDKDTLKTLVKYIQAVKSIDASNPIWPDAPDVP